MQLRALALNQFVGFIGNLRDATDRAFFSGSRN
jgi:hypothetical protein